MRKSEMPRDFQHPTVSGEPKRTQLELEIAFDASGQKASVDVHLPVLNIRDLRINYMKRQRLFVVLFRRSLRHWKLLRARLGDDSSNLIATERVMLRCREPREPH